MRVMRLFHDTFEQFRCWSSEHTPTWETKQVLLGYAGSSCLYVDLPVMHYIFLLNSEWSGLHHRIIDEGFVLGL